MKKRILVIGMVLVMSLTLSSCKIVDKLKKEKDSNEEITMEATSEKKEASQEITTEPAKEKKGALELENGKLQVDQDNIEALFKLKHKEIFDVFKGEYTEDYYNGAKYVSFKESNVALLFNEIDFDTDKIKEDAKVVGVMMGGKSTAFGIMQGMYPPEIISILGNPKSEGEDLSGEGFDWGMDYEINNYWIHLGMDAENQPIQSIEIYPVKNY